MTEPLDLYSETILKNNKNFGGGKRRMKNVKLAGCIVVHSPKLNHI